MKKIYLKIILSFFVATIYGQNTWTVDVGGFSDVYIPSNLPAVQVGDTVIWNNIGGYHNVNGTQTTYPNNPESFGYDMSSWFTMVGNPTSSWIFTHVFTIAGTYTYQCDPHVGMGMIGTIIVNSISVPGCTDPLASN